MRAHDIQPGRHSWMIHDVDDEPSATVNIRRYGFWYVVNLLAFGFSTMVCVAGAAGSALMLGIVVVNGKRFDWDWFFEMGLWEALPYTFLLFPIWRYRQSLRASTFLFLAALVISTGGLYFLGLGLAEFFHPLRRGCMCCFGPSAPFDVPLFQMGPVAGCWAAAARINRFEIGNRYV